MIFTTPIPFAQAIQSRKVKALLPSELSSKEFSTLPAQLKQLSSFSATVDKYEILDKFHQLSDSILQPLQVDRAGKLVITGDTLVSARKQMREFFKGIGFQPDPDKAGTIQDISSSARINLKLKTDVQMAQGFGYQQQGQTEAILDVWPAQELYRAVKPRGHERNWGQRWLMAAQRAGDGAATLAWLDHKRMVARKDSTIWLWLGSPELFADGLGNTFAPFAFNSGMDLRDVDRVTAIKLGVIDAETKVLPQIVDFNDLIKASPAVRSESLRASMLEELGEDYEFKDGILRRAA